MYQEFNQHKKSDAVKWIIAFTLIIVLMAGVVAALILSLDKPTPIKPQENGTQQESSDESNAAVVLTLGQPRLMSVKSPALAADNTQQYVSQTVTATITPSTVVDKYVVCRMGKRRSAQRQEHFRLYQGDGRFARQSYGNGQLLQVFQRQQGNSYLHYKTRRQNRNCQYRL